MRTSRGALALALPLVLASACKKKDEWKPTVTKITSVTVVTPGGDPKPLRFKFTAGQQLSLKVDMFLSIDTKVDGSAMPLPKIPGITMSMDVHIDSVLPTGDAKWTATLAKMDVMDTPGAEAVADKLRGPMHDAKGFKGTGTFTTTGRLTDASFKLDPDAPTEVKKWMDAMRQQMVQMMPPLPDDPIGAGGKWAVVSESESSGITLTTTTISEIQSVGPKLTFTSTITGTAPAGKVSVPNLPAGAQLSSLTSNGSATYTVDLSRPWPVAIDQKLDVQVDMTTQGKRVELTLGTQTKTTGM